MEDYKELYYQLFNSVTEAIMTLEKSLEKAEELFILAEDQEGGIVKNIGHKPKK